MDKKDSLAFKDVYILYYPRLKRFTKEYILIEEDAENIVHDVFADLWEHWDTFSSHNNLLAFLFISVKNRCIDLLRRNTKLRHIENAIAKEYQLALSANCNALESFMPDIYGEKELEDRIEAAINSLPERCREIFIKSKLEGKKHKEISEELNISVKTIESQMAIAYKKLRDELKDLLPLFIFFIN